MNLLLLTNVHFFLRFIDFIYSICSLSPMLIKNIIHIIDSVGWWQSSELFVCHAKVHINGMIIVQPVFVA